MKIKYLICLLPCALVVCSPPDKPKPTLRGEVIAEQTFKFKDSILGPATFIPTVDQDGSPNDRLTLYVQPVGKETTELPSANIGFSFYRLLAVSFEDLNKDGLLDIVLIAQYIPGAGPNAAQPFDMCLIYLRNKSSFTFEPIIADTVMSMSKDRINVAQVRSLFAQAARKNGR